MPTRFPSKVDAWLAAVMGLGIVVMVSAGVFLLVAPPDPPALFVTIGVVSLLLAIMVAVILLNTHYIIADGKLFIRCGPFRGTVVIADIEKVTPTRNPLSSPACSLDRLNIDYRVGATSKWVMISPQDKVGFLRALAEADANLQVEGDRAVRVSVSGSSDRAGRP